MTVGGDVSLAARGELYFLGLFVVLLFCFVEQTAWRALVSEESLGFSFGAAYTNQG